MPAWLMGFGARRDRSSRESASILLIRLDRFRKSPLFPSKPNRPAPLLLDGKPPQVPPNTFTHVPFGPHRLSATLDNYEPLKQDIQVREG